MPGRKRSFKPTRYGEPKDAEAEKARILGEVKIGTTVYLEADRILLYFPFPSHGTPERAVMDCRRRLKGMPTVDDCTLSFPALQEFCEDYGLSCLIGFGRAGEGAALRLKGFSNWDMSYTENVHA